MINKLLAAAKAEVGTKESPPNSNNCKYNDWYYGKDISGANLAWCCVFIAWLFETTGLSALWVEGKTKVTASCAYVMSTAKKAGQWVTSGYKAGDCVLFDFDNDKQPNHIGIVESVTADGKTLMCYEGNTSSDDKGSQSDGGEVCYKKRAVSKVLGAFRPKYVDNVPQFDSSAQKGVDAVIALGKAGRASNAEKWAVIVRQIDAGLLTADDRAFALNNLKYLFAKWWEDYAKEQETVGVQ